MVTQTVMDMPKKKTTTDGRRNRYQPITAAEFRKAKQVMETLCGEFESAAQEIEALRLTGAQIDGRNLLEDAIADLKTIRNRVKTALYQERLTRE